MSSILLELPAPSAAHGGLWYSTPASTRFGRHHHRELELNVLVSGQASYWFPHRELRIAAPAILWIPPHVEHELLDVSHDLSMWVHSVRRPADPAAASSAGAGVPERPSALQAALHELSDGPCVTGVPPAALAQVCARSREGLLRPAVPRLNELLSEIVELGWTERRPPAEHEAAAPHPAARRAAALLRGPDASRSMLALARSTALSRERLSRVFAHCFGIGLVQYRNHHRVQRFIHAFGHGSNTNMLHAALEVGFGSYVQFHRAFTQVVGYPPARHLERVRDGIVDPARTGGGQEPLVRGP